jgi:hypothetical protein
MNSLKYALSKGLIMVLLIGLISSCFTGCSGKNEGKKNGNDSKVTSVPTSQSDSELNKTEGDTESKTNGQPTDSAGNGENSETANEEGGKSIKEVDSESALKLATGLILGIAKGSIIPTEQTTVVVVKPGEKSCMIGSYDILKDVELIEVPKINIIDSKNAAWRISFTYKPEITVEVIDDAENPKEAIKLYPGPPDIQ